MSDDDSRSWAERRIDARRERSGLPTGRAGKVQERLVSGGLLAVVGVLLVLRTSGVGVAIGVVLCAIAVYQFVTAAIAQGVRDGHEGR